MNTQKSIADLASATCLHCGSENTYDPEIGARFTCQRCGWFNDLYFNELDGVPIKILPADLPQKWAVRNLTEGEFHVAYVPFQASDLRALTSDQRAGFEAIWDKLELSPEDHVMIDAVKAGALDHQGQPYLTIKGTKLVSTTRGQGIRISTIYVRDGVLRQDGWYDVVLRPEATTPIRFEDRIIEQQGPAILCGRLQLKGYPDEEPIQFQFRLPVSPGKKGLDKRATYTVMIYDAIPEKTHEQGDQKHD